MKISSKKMRSIRRKKGLSRLKLSELLGVSHTSVSVWEHGIRQPKKSNIKQLSKVLGTGVLDTKGKNDSLPENLIDPLKLKFYRKRAGLTQIKLSESLGTLKANVWFWEHGKRFVSRKTLEKLAKRLKVDEKYLLKDELGGVPLEPRIKGKSVLRRRIELDMTLKKLADELNVSASCVKFWETERHRIPLRLHDDLIRILGEEVLVDPKNAAAVLPKRYCGMKIRRRRKELGLSMKELGKLVGVTDSSIFYWERETAGIRPEYRKALREALEVDEKDILKEIKTDSDLV